MEKMKLTSFCLKALNINYVHICVWHKFSSSHFIEQEIGLPNYFVSSHNLNVIYIEIFDGRGLITGLWNVSSIILTTILEIEALSASSV